MPTFPEPSTATGTASRCLELLDFYRDVLVLKLEGLTPEQLTTSVLPSGWTPAGLVHHVARTERRWISWGFAGEPVDDPWADSGDGDGWCAPDVADEDLVGTLQRLLGEAAAVTRRVVADNELSARARLGGRFTDETDAPRLDAVLLHLVQEYARHAGHLDVARELIDGRVGEDRR